MDLTRALERWKAILAAENPGIIGKLRPGLAPDVVVAALADADIPAVAELVELYGWHDGVEAEGSTIDELYFMPSLMFSPLSWAIDDYLHFAGDEILLREIPFLRRKMKILSDGCGEGYLVGLPDAPSETVPVYECQLVHFYGYVDMPRYDSIREMVEHFIAMIDDGVFVRSESGFLYRDITADPLLAQLHQIEG